MATVFSNDIVPALGKRSAKQPPFTVSFNAFIVGVMSIAAVAVMYRSYQQFFALSKGLDATSEDFATYWLPVFRLELPVLFGAGLACWSYLLLTRDKALERVTPVVELKRYFYLTMWLVAYSFAVYWTGSFFAEGDGMWHQTVLRDTPITPSHIVLFYACIPIYLFFGIGSFIYAMTRIPAFCRGISIMHVFAVVGPFLIMPNLGFNEWGHAYWLTEEIFSHPLHWGFVMLGWAALGLPGVLMQILGRMRELVPMVFGSRGEVKAADA